MGHRGGAVQDHLGVIRKLDGSDRGGVRRQFKPHLTVLQPAEKGLGGEEVQQRGQRAPLPHPRCKWNEG